MTRAEIEVASPLLEEHFDTIIAWLQDTKRTRHERPVDRRAVLRTFLDTKNVYRTAVQVGCSPNTVREIVEACMGQVRRLAGIPPVASAPKYPALASFAWRVKLVRYQRGWSQKEAARQARMAINYYRRVERANLNPSLLGTIRLAQALGVSVRHLIEGD